MLILTSIAVFGSAFNPPHRGHINAIEQLLPYFEQVIVVPSAAHAFGKNMAPFAQRMTMTQLIVDEFLPQQNVTISNIEWQIKQHLADNNPIYSYDLLVELQKAHPNDQLTLVIGPDNAAPETWKKFYRHQDIEDQFSLFTVEEQLPFRSTQARETIAHVNNEELISALSAGHGTQVATYLQQQKLYSG